LPLRMGRSGSQNNSAANQPGLKPLYVQVSLNRLKPAGSFQIYHTLPMIWRPLKGAKLAMLFCPYCKVPQRRNGNRTSNILPPILS